MRETAWRTDEPCPVCADRAGPGRHRRAGAAGRMPPVRLRRAVRHRRHRLGRCLVTAGRTTRAERMADAAGPPGGQGPGRRARRLPAAGAAAPDRDRHRPRRAGPDPVRAHPGLGVPVVRRAGPDPAGRAMPRRLAPGPRTRHRPGPGYRGPAGTGHSTEPRRKKAGTSWPAKASIRLSWMSGSASWTRRSPMPGFAARSCLRGHAATAPPGAARTPLPCPAARSAPGRSARPTPRRTARPSGPRCSSR